jgi:RHS repeat-associated protein
VKANQLGLSTETARARTFAYDSLSRLTNACNPESNGGSACTGTGPWSASYTYDANGNTHTKATLYPATETNYYDALNRLYESTHSDQTPSEQFTYDLAAGISGSNSVGHVVAENLVDPGGKTLAQRHYTSFDTMGRLLTEDQCSIYSGSLNNCGTSKTALSYTYDLAGNVITSGSGANVPIGGTSQPIALTYTYDSASHLQKITSNWIDSTHPGTLFNAPSTTGAPAYSPFGGLLAANLSYSNATQQPQILLNRTYDIRGRAATAVYSTTDGGSPAKQSAGSIAVPSSSAEQSTTATGSGTITISGSNASCIFYPAPGYPQTFWDAGNITVVVNGVSYNAGGYGGAGITPAQIAAGVASGMNGIPSAPVTATSQGGVVTLVAKPGSGTLNYSYSVSVAGTPNPPCTTNPPVPFSVSPSSASFTSGTVYDSGTITVFVNGSTATATYGQGSTAASVASAIQSAVQSAAGSFLTAGLSGDTVSLSSNQANSSTNWPVSVSVSYNSAYFSHASFPVSSSGMSGGANAQNVTLYSYNLGALSNGKHGYDSVGNVTGFQDTVMGEWNFGYDHLNRLDLATGVGGTYNGGAIANQTISWIYDSFGNRKNQTPSSGAPFPTEWANYGASNRITGSSQGGVGYNGPGAVNADGINNYTLDSEDRVCNWVTQITGLPKQPYTNVYDAGGHRVAKGTVTNSGTCEATQNGFAATETTILGQGGEQVTALGPGTSWAHTNVYADGQLLATYDAGGLHFALNDWLGTKRMQVTAAGGFENSWQSLPFGDNPAPMAQGGASDHHFTGQLHDNESQLDYFQARFYSSTLGRFQSPDWSGDAVPVPYANLSDPQSLNLYAYVRNNPISKVDADGHLEKHFSVGGDGWGVGDGWPAGVGYGRSMHNLLTRYNASLLAQAEDFDIENELRREPWDEAENALKPVGPDQQVAPEWPPAGAIYPERGEKGPLDALERSKDFTWYVRWKTKQETTLYRMWGDPAELTGKGNGTYYSLFPPERSTDFMRDQMSLPSKWNSMENLDPVKFPAGTTMYVGPASAQAGFRGGGFQVFVPKP